MYFTPLQQEAEQEPVHTSVHGCLQAQRLGHKMITSVQKSGYHGLCSCVLVLLSYYEAEICATLLLLRCPFRWCFCRIFSFWPKTMDYSQGFWPKLRSFFVVFLLLVGRCYEAEICTILFPLRCAFTCLFFAESNFSVSSRKPWTIVRGFISHSSSSILKRCFPPPPSPSTPPPSPLPPSPHRSRCCHPHTLQGSGAGHSPLSRP